MIFFKPAWINHEDNKPIFSVDIHPKGNRFATGGQGGSGGRIVIWNVSPVTNENDESNPSIAKMLCQMDNHLACVNVVRWSNSGHFLASGSDDKLVMIWRLSSEGSSSIFGSNKVNVETWKCIHTLNSHNGDVLDLAWAPHDGWLASSSVDNSVIVWNAHKFPEKVAVLKTHTGMVKGVTWDPVGKYLASQSDDKSLRIWRTSDWAQQEVVTDPFQECSATTHVLRCSWSPDGQYLVSAHAMNGGGPTAQIIEREGWKQDKDFVGHRKAVTCVRFNSNILKKASADSPKKTTQYCCCAIGSRDRSISVWLTSLKRPLVVIKDLFDDSVLDISWNAAGNFLLACSWDGTVACVTFGQSEIGVPLSVDEKNALYERMYHKSLQNSWNTNFSGTQIVEDAELLCAIDEMNEKTKEVVLDLPEIKEPPKAKDVCYESPKPSQNLLVPVNKQVETRLPSGKRRITPMLLTAVSPSPTTNGTSNNLWINTESTQFFSQSAAFSKSSPTKSQIIVETRTEPEARPAPVAQPKPVSQQKVQVSETVVSKPPGPEINQLMCVDVPGDEPITKFISILDPCKFTPGTTVTKDAGILKVQVTNNCHRITNNLSLSKIEVCKKSSESKEPIWETFLGSQIRTLATNRKLLVACCEDLTVNTYDLKSGARSLPALLIEDLVSCLSLSEKGHLLVLTKTGLMHMWDLCQSKSVLSRISVRCLLIGKATVTGCSLTPSNQPILTLSDGRAYSYSLDLQTWVQLSNPLDPVSRSSASMVRKVPHSLPLASLQRAMPQYNLTDSSLPPGVTLSFLESQITATNVLQSVTEYRHWLLAQVNHLLDKGPECRLKLILDDLIGPTHSSVKKSKLDTEIMGLSRRKLFEEILNVIKTKLPWQRLYKEYSEQLRDGVKKPFTEVIKANIGDCHAMGQVPITFIRQVLTLVTDPSLLDDSRFPDDAKERARTILKGCRGGSVGSYTDSPGIEIIRRHVAQYIERRDCIPADWQNVVISAGASDGIKNILKLMICHVGGKPPGVLIPIPQYPLYSASLAEFGINQVGYYLNESKNWSLDISELQRAITEAKKNCNVRAIVVINPGNPTGQVLPRENIEEIIKFAYKERLFVLADEVYQDNIYAPGSKFYSFKKVLVEMGEPYSSMELASFMSCSKGYMGECGLRGGYTEVVNMCPKVKAMYLKAISAMLCPTTLGQSCLDAIVNPPQKGEPSYESFIKEKTAVLDSLKLRAKMVADTFNSMEGFSCNTVQGAMYAFPQITLPQKAIEAAKSEGKQPDVFYAFELLENTGICIVPGSGFGQKPGTYHFRTTILPQPEKLKSMLEKFAEFHTQFIKKYS